MRSTWLLSPRTRYFLRVFPERQQATIRQTLRQVGVIVGIMDLTVEIIAQQSFQGQKPDASLRIPIDAQDFAVDQSVLHIVSTKRPPVEAGSARIRAEPQKPRAS